MMLFLIILDAVSIIATIIRINIMINRVWSQYCAFILSVSCKPIPPAPTTPRITADLVLDSKKYKLCEINIGKIIQKPWVINNNIKIQYVIDLSITFDHRAVDGADAARFLDTYIQYLTNIDWLK